MLVHARDPHVESGAFHLRRPLGFGDEFLLTYSWINSRRTSVMFWPWAAVAALKVLCNSTGTFRFIRFTCCGSGCLIALTSFQEVSISGDEYGMPEGTLACHSYLPQAWRQSIATLKMSCHSIARPAATACNCSRVLGTAPASMASHSAAAIPAARLASSTERLRVSRAERIRSPKNSPQTWRS